MSVGFSILAHRNMSRVAQLACALADAGFPVVLHVDAATKQADFDWLRARLARYDSILFSPRMRSAWGQFSLVQAQIDAAALLLARNPTLGHVCQLSGDSLPTRPLDEFKQFLASKPDVDFIESVTAGAAHWIKGGLEHERFTLYFPFNWKTQRRRFDLSVALQRRFGVKRKMPVGLVAHIGSQWWVLSSRTLRAILDDPRRAAFNAFFKRTWIPDESYFQTLARLHSNRIESRSLCFARFDYEGKPLVFYDDHLGGLESLETFFARKIWSGADALYARLLDQSRPALARQPHKREALLRQVAVSERRRLDGRRGLMMQARHVGPYAKNTRETAVPYVVLQGLDAVFDDLPEWLEAQTGQRAMGRIFCQDGAQFGGGAQVGPGGLSSLAVVRDYRPVEYLRNFVWAQRNAVPVFQFDLADNPKIARAIEIDSNARILHVRSAWLLQLMRQDRADPIALREQAAMAVAQEKEHLRRLMRESCPARAFILPLGQVLANPTSILMPLVQLMAPGRSVQPLELPKVALPAGLGQFIAELKNGGVNLTYNDDGQDLRSDTQQQRARLLS